LGKFVRRTQVQAQGVLHLNLASGDRFVVTANGAAGGALTIDPDGPEAYSALFSAPAPESDSIGPAADARARLERLNARSRAIVEGLSKKDYGPIAEAFGPRMPRERIERMESAMWANREARLGAFRSVKPVGTARTEGGDYATLVQVQHERGPGWLVYMWNGDALVGIDALENPPSPRFVPVTSTPALTEFAGWSIQNGSSGRIRFEAAGEAQVLRVGGVTAKKQPA
jgi:hypothetical protein